MQGIGEEEPGPTKVELRHAGRAGPSGDGWQVWCACGWCSSIGTAHDQTRRHRSHVRLVAATEAVRTAGGALDRASRARRLMEDQRLVRRRSRWSGRRVAAVRRRASAQRELHRRLVRASRRQADPCSPSPSLEAARVLARLSRYELWVGYVGNGGTLSMADVRDVLVAGRPVGRLDHEQLVCTLNEHFDDDGLGRPLDAPPASRFWGGEAQPA